MVIQDKTTQAEDAIGRALAPHSDAVVALDAEDRVARVGAEPGSDLAARLSGWLGRPLADVLDAAGFRAVQALRADRSGGRALATTAREEGAVPLSVAVDAHGRLHLRDEAGTVEMQGQLARALAALAADAREDRALEARHRALLAEMAEAVAVVHAETGRIVEMTGGAARMMGGDAARLAGAAFTQFFEGRRRSEFIDGLVAAALFGGTEETRAELRHGRGTIRIRPSIFRTDDGTVLVCRMSRATGREPAAPPRGVPSLVARSPDGIACLDADGIVMHANAAFVGMVGAPSPSRIVGQPLAVHLLRGEIDLRALFSGDRPAAFVTRIGPTGGRRRPVEIAASALDHGGLGLIARDLTLAPVTRGAAPVVAGEGLPDTASLVGSAPLRDIVAATTEAVERSCIVSALSLTEGNVAAAAEMLGLSRQSLYVKLRKFDLPSRDAD